MATLGKSGKMYLSVPLRGGGLVLNLLSQSWRWCNLSPQHWDQLKSGWHGCCWLVVGRCEWRVGGRASGSSFNDKCWSLRSSQISFINRTMLWGGERLTGKNILVSVFAFIFRPLSFFPALFYLSLQFLKSLLETEREWERKTIRLWHKCRQYRLHAEYKSQPSVLLLLVLLRPQFQIFFFPPQIVMEQLSENKCTNSKVQISAIQHA